MTKGIDSKIYIKSGNRRIDLYAEVGRFFSADGHPDEDTFRAHVRENLHRLTLECKEKDELERLSGEWVSSFLEKITGYLNEKGLHNEAVLLFRAGIEEASRHRVHRVWMPADQLQTMFACARSPLQKVRKNDAALNRENIFNAALTLFVEKGFHSTTVDEIADLSGVGKGTVYRNFKTKEELLEQLIEERTSEIVSIFSKVLTKEGDILRLIEEAISYWVLFIEHNHLLYRLIQKEEIMYKPGGKAMFYNTVVNRLPMLKERVVAKNTGGRLKTMNFYTTFYGIMGFIDGVVYKWLQSGMDYRLQDELPVILEVLFNGFIGAKTEGKRFFIPPEETQGK